MSMVRLEDLGDKVLSVLVVGDVLFPRGGLGRVVGGAADGRIVAVRQGNLVATSFHPELTGDRRVHALFVEIVRAHLAERSEENS